MREIDPRRQEGIDQELLQTVAPLVLAPRQRMEETLVYKHRAKLQQAVEKGDKTILVAGTGSGKTIAINSIFPGGRKIMTENKRKGTEEAAKFVAQIDGTQLGEKVAYQYRGSGHGLSETAEMIFMTEGTLVSILFHDPLLEGFDTVVFDEVQSETEDLLILEGILLKVQEERKKIPGVKPLKIIAMTATPNDLEELKAYFEITDEQVVTVEGNLHTVEELYLEEDVYARDMPQKAAEILFTEILLNDKRKHQKGNILTFMTGEKPILETEKAVREAFNNRKNSMIEELGEVVALQQLRDAGLITASGDFALRIIPFHSQLSEEELNRVLASSNERTLLIATDIAETGLTLENLQFVIDSGLVNQVEFNPRTGLETIIRRECSKNSIKQRTGRAGRLLDGVRFGLYTKKNFEDRDKARLSEIERKNPMAFVMRLKKYGIHSMDDIKLLKKPKQESLEYAIRTLKKWGALDAGENLTDLGKLMVELGIEPRYAYLVAQGIENKCVQQACTIAAYLSGSHAKPLFKGEGDEFNTISKSFHVDDQSDFHSILNFWEEYQKNKRNNTWPGWQIVNRNTLKGIEDIRKDLVETLKERKVLMSSSSDLLNIDRTITQTFLDRIFIREESGRTYKALDGHGGGTEIDQNSALARSLPKVIIIGDENERNIAKQVHHPDIYIIDELDSTIIKRFLNVPEYNEKDDVVQQKKALFIASVPLEVYEDVPVASEVAAKVLAKVLAKASMKDLIPLPICVRNIETMNRFNAQKSGTGIDAINYFSLTDLEAFYEERLKKLEITSKKGILEALASGADFTLQLIKPNEPPPPQPPRGQQEKIISPYIVRNEPLTFMEKVLSVRDRFVGFFKNLFGQPPIPQT